MNFTCQSCGSVSASAPYMSVWCTECLSKDIDRLEVFQGSVTDCVYGLYNEENQLLYIGVTNHPVRRMHSHREAKRFSRMKIVATFDSRKDADDFEKYAIWRKRPPLNVRYEKDWSKVSPHWGKDLALIGTAPPKKAKGRKGRARPNSRGESKRSIRDKKREESKALNALEREVRRRSICIFCGKTPTPQKRRVVVDRTGESRYVHTICLKGFMEERGKG